MKLDYTYDYTQEELNEKLSSAAFNNDFELIKELLTSPKLKLYAQINSNPHFLGNICCGNDPIGTSIKSRNNIDILRYVFTSPDLKEHADIHIDNERALCCAIYSVDIPMIKYLLTSPELKEHSNLYHTYGYSDVVFESIFKVREFEKSNKLIEYFTLDYAIKTKDVKVYRKLFDSADNSDSEELIKYNLLANLMNEEDESHKETLIEVLKDLEPSKIEMYNKISLKKILDADLPTSANKNLNKLKV